MARSIKQRRRGPQAPPSATTILAAIKAGVITHEQGVLAREAQMAAWREGLESHDRRDTLSLRGIATVASREDLGDLDATSPAEQLDSDVTWLSRTRLFDPTATAKCESLERRGSGVLDYEDALPSDDDDDDEVG